MTKWHERIASMAIAIDKQGIVRLRGYIKIKRQNRLKYKNNHQLKDKFYHKKLGLYLGAIASVILAYDAILEDYSLFYQIWILFTFIMFFSPFINFIIRNKPAIDIQENKIQYRDYFLSFRLKTIYWTKVKRIDFPNGSIKIYLENNEEVISMNGIKDKDKVENVIVNAYTDFKSSAGVATDYLQKESSPA